MLSLLEQLQNGTLSSTSFMFQETTDRVFNLEMSNRRDLEKVHTSTINTLDIEGVENRYLLSGDNHGNISIHDLFQFTRSWPATSSSVCNIDQNSRHAHSLGVDTLQWYPFDTGMFISSSMDEKVKVWDTAALKPVETLKMRGKVYCHHLSTVATHHCLIATATTYPHVVLVDMKTGSQCHELRGHNSEVMTVRWSPSAEYILASGGKDNRIFLWDIRSAKSYLCCLDQHNGEALTSSKDIVTAHNGVINGLCFSTDGLYLISFGKDHRLKLWDVASARNTLVNFGKVSNISIKHVQFDLCYDATVPVVFVPTKNRIQVFDMFRGNAIATLIGHFNDVRCCSYRTFFHELYSGGYDRNLVLWTPDVKRELISESSGVDADQTQKDNWSD